jgi:hypothetical protein
MDGQSPRQPVNDDVAPRHQSTVKVNGQWSTVKGVRSVNLLNFLVFWSGSKGSKGSDKGSDGLEKVQKGRMPGQKGHFLVKWSKGYFWRMFHRFYAFSEAIHVRFSRMSSQFRLSRRSGSNHALRFSC